MAVPTLTDVKTLAPYASGGGQVSAPAGALPLVAKGPSNCVARYHYGGASLVKPGEEATILARYHVPATWAGGGTILRVESYADPGQLLCRLEIDVFKDGHYWIVRNAHINSGATQDYTALKQGPVQIVGRQYDIALHFKLDAGNNGFARLYLDGNLAASVNGRTWWDNNFVVERARYCLVQGPTNTAEARLYAAELVPGFKAVPGGVAPPPPPPPPDPCVEWKDALTVMTNDRNDWRQKAEDNQTAYDQLLAESSTALADRDAALAQVDGLRAQLDAESDANDALTARIEAAKLALG